METEMSSVFFSDMVWELWQRDLSISPLALKQEIQRKHLIHIEYKTHSSAPTKYIQLKPVCLCTFKGASVCEVLGQIQIKCSSIQDAISLC